MSTRCSAKAHRRALMNPFRNGEREIWIVRLQQCERAAGENGYCWQHARMMKAGHDMESAKSSIQIAGPSR